jgi:hypothetical protein
MSCKNQFVGRVVYCILIAAVSFGCRSINGQAQNFSLELDSNGRWVNGVTEPWWFSESAPKEDVAAAQRQWKVIGNETITAGDSLWAGDYFIGGDTHGSYLRWSLQNGFVLFHVNKCEARVMGFSYGKVVFSPSLIQLLPEKTVSDSTKHGHNRHSTLRLLPIRWRQVRYLVPENKMADFADYVAGLGEYNDSSFTLIEYAQFFSQSVAQTPGLAGSAVRNKNSLDFIEPVVPPGYERFIKKPIDAKITGKGKSYLRRNPENEWWDDLVIPVTIDAGSADGLKTKMSLRVVGSEGFGSDDEVVKTMKVGLHSARGVIERPVRKRPCVKFDPADDCKDPDYQPVKLGSRVTTNPVRENSESDR